MSEIIMILSIYLILSVQSVEIDDSTAIIDYGLSASLRISSTISDATCKKSSCKGYFLQALLTYQKQ